MADEDYDKVVNEVLEAVKGLQIKVCGRKKQIEVRSISPIRVSSTILVSLDSRTDSTEVVPERFHGIKWRNSMWDWIGNDGLLCLPKNALNN